MPPEVAEKTPPEAAEQTPITNDKGVTVVTTDNFERYVQETVGSPAGVKVEEAAEEPEAEEEAADDGKSNPKGKGRLNERFSELTKARKDAEAKAQSEADRAAKAEALAAELRAKYEPPPEEKKLGPKPLPEQFKDTVEYGKALEDWTTEKVRHDDAVAAKETEVKAAREKVVNDWKAREIEAKEKYPDYEEVISKADNIKISNELLDAIMESDAGHDIRYHLATHPDVAEALGKLTIGQMLKAVGKLEAELGGAAKPSAKSEGKPPQVSKAPAPITPLKGGTSAPSVKVDAEGNFHGTYEEYKAARVAGKIK